MTTDDRPWPLTTRRIDPVRLVVSTAPAVELWTTADAAVQQHLRLDDDSDSTYVALVLAAARRHFEAATGLALITQSYTATWELPPAGRVLELPRAPLQAVTAVTYLDSAGASATLGSSAYTVPLGSPGAFGRVALRPDYDWPEVGDYAAAFSVAFRAGYGDAATAVPEEIRLAVLWLAAWWYEERQPVNVGNITSALPHHLADILQSHRVAFIA